MAAAAQDSSEAAAVWRLLEGVPDPEIPVLSIVDLGIVRHVHCAPGEPVRVGLTPTYSGCPATDAIRASVRRELALHGHGDALIEDVLAPPWSSDWLTAAGRTKLAAFGIAPPTALAARARGGWCAPPPPHCPRCQSAATECLSEFGSTPCKSHHRCRACGEPFDHFKCI